MLSDETIRHILAHPDDPRHGQLSTYVNARCRCTSCRSARADYMRAFRARQRATAQKDQP